MSTFPWAAACIAVLALGACGRGDRVAAAPPRGAPSRAPAAPTPQPLPQLDMAQLTAFFASEPSAPPSDNEPTPETVALGRLLYHEKSLSRNGDRSCATCHDLDRYGQDNLPTPPGDDGRGGDRSTPTTLNAYRQFRQFWDGRAGTVEQAVVAGPGPGEHGIAGGAELVPKLRASPGLVAAFQKAFPDDAEPVSVQNVTRAIGAFERTLATRSPFDAFLDGDRKALTAEQQWGLQAFIDVGCTQCHVTRLCGGSMIQKLGVLEPYPSAADPGRFRVTGDEADRDMFKVPSLCNVEKTAPYFHDGRAATLDEAVRTMARIQLGKQLTDGEVAAIVAFLRALTGKLPEGVAAQAARPARPVKAPRATK